MAITDECFLQPVISIPPFHGFLYTCSTWSGFPHTPSLLVRPSTKGFKLGACQKLMRPDFWGTFKGFVEKKEVLESSYRSGCSWVSSSYFCYFPAQASSLCLELWQKLRNVSLGGMNILLQGIALAPLLTSITYNARCKL